MNNLNQIPLARLVIPLIVGIGCGLWLPFVLPDVLFYPAVILVLGSLVFLSIKDTRFAAWFGLLTTVFFMLIGVKLVELHTAANQPAYFGKYLSADNFIVARIIEPPQEKAKSVKALLQIESIKQGKTWVKASGTLLAYFALDETATHLAYGDKVLIRNKIEEVKPPQNPGQFDNKRYLANKGIYHQTYLTTEHYAILESNVVNAFYAWVYKVRAKLLWQLRESGLKGQELAVASALLLGYDDDIDSDLLQAYSASGTMHILSVSGMHAGLVYIAFLWLLQFAGQSLPARILRTALVIAMLWLYALLTGFSPPVIRAAAMFSMLALGQSLNRYTNAVNILAGSCLIMLLLNPFLLADVGFQLSYTAVFGIALLYTPVYTVWEFKRWLPDKIWQITAMSLVAQLVTFPLGLFYFHQFPNYFVFSNLLIIPLSTVAIFTGIALLALSFIPFVAEGIGFLLHYIVLGLNWLVMQSEQLPLAVDRNINISILEMAAVYFIIAAFAISLYYKKKVWLYAALAISVLYMGGRIYHNHQILTQQKLIVYSVNKATAIEFVSGSNSVLLADSAALPGTVNYKFNVESALWYYGIDNRMVFAPNNNQLKPFAVLGDKSLLIANGKLNTEGIAKADYVLISNTPYIDFDALQKLQPRIVIIGSNNKPKKVQYFIKEFEKRGIKYYNVAQQGAFIADS